jgi:hypothetical protein
MLAQECGDVYQQINGTWQSGMANTLWGEVFQRNPQQQVAHPSRAR